MGNQDTAGPILPTGFHTNQQMFSFLINTMRFVVHFYDCFYKKRSMYHIFQNLVTRMSLLLQYMSIHVSTSLSDRQLGGNMNCLRAIQDK